MAWVLGGTGLLGAALLRALRSEGTTIFAPAARLPWNDGAALGDQMAAAVQAFARQVANAQRWEVHWAAGVGTMGSAPAGLAAETAALSGLLDCLAAEPDLFTMPGCISFASSAGAIYAGASGDIVTEHTPPAPTTAYAEEKLKQEGLLHAFVAAHPNTTVLIARISTLYGSGQSAAKKQGLLSHMARCVLRHQPIQIFVPYDTIRDYIDADDAAVAVLGNLRMASRSPQLLTKIIASEAPVTIAEIVSIFKRLSRQAPRIVRSGNRLSSLYTRCMQFRSVVQPQYTGRPGKRLPLGISQLIAAERATYLRAASPAVGLLPSGAAPRTHLGQAGHSTSQGPTA
jgi:UDP-glucose 4-epimerase